MLLDIATVTKEQEACMKLKGVLDIATVEAFMSAYLTLPAVEKLVIDFEGIEFIDSTGIGALAQALTECREKNVFVKVTNINPQVYEVLNILGLPEIFGLECFEIKQIQ